MRSEVLDAAGPAGLILRVEFVWRGDRYGHVISNLEPGGSRTPLLESMEGTPADEWPSSPPLQSLHRETLAGGRAALLLVGAAGRSHWSASIEAGSGPGELTFDMACRTGGAATQVGSEYLLRPNALEFFRIQPDEVEFFVEASRLRIRPRPIMAPTVRWRYSIRLSEP